MDDFFPLMDEQDHLILMHRDAHFGGSFSLMLDYYNEENKGVQPDFEIERIEELALLERELQKNLSDLVLTEPEKEEVQYSIDKYLLLRQAYSAKAKDSIPSLIADLIFSEKEEPEAEIEALVTKGKVVVPYLINLLVTDEFYNPLFPGYGQAPSLAATVLGKIKDEQAIKPLFEALGKEDFFSDEAILNALAHFGEKAKDFILKRLQAKPITKENEYAAMALLHFEESEGTSKTCLSLLQDDQILKRPSLSAYLILGCSALTSSQDQKTFFQLTDHPSLSPDLKEEIQFIGKKWKKHTSKNR
jgi:HEAT repeat protein